MGAVRSIRGKPTGPENPDEYLLINRSSTRSAAVYRELTGRAFIVILIGMQACRQTGMGQGPSTLLGGSVYKRAYKTGHSSQRDRLPWLRGLESMRVDVDDRAASSLHKNRQMCVQFQTAQGTALLLSTSRVLVCFVATLASLVTAATDPLHIASAKKHHTLLAAANMLCAC